MKTLVTGGGGFIGSNLLRQLCERGDEVVTTLRPGASRTRLAEVHASIVIEEVDLRNREVVTEVFARYRPELVYHLASSGWGRHQAKGGHEEGIVSVTESLLDAMDRQPPRRLVTTGSAAEYGSGLRFGEQDPCRPNTALGKAKLRACDRTRAWTARNNIENVWLRVFTPFGEWEEPGRLVPHVIRRALVGQAIELSTPAEVRDFVSVAELVRAMILAGQQPLPSQAVINVCSGAALTAAEMARRVLIRMGLDDMPSIQQAGPRRGEVLAASSGERRRAAQWLGWSPEPLDQGIDRAIQWWKEHAEWSYC
jgi:nucleoside-diphosphate-sugar epimerase